MKRTEQSQSDEAGAFGNTESIEVKIVHGNLAQELIMITVDRLHLRLIEHSSAIRKKNSWLVPLGIFVPVLISVLTADFKNFILADATWEALFVLIGIASFIWFLYELHSVKESPSINDLIEKIKESDQTN